MKVTDSLPIPQKSKTFVTLEAAIKDVLYCLVQLKANDQLIHASFGNMVDPFFITPVLNIPVDHILDHNLLNRLAQCQYLYDLIALRDIQDVTQPCPLHRSDNASAKALFYCCEQHALGRDAALRPQGPARQRRPALDQ